MEYWKPKAPVEVSHSSKESITEALFLSHHFLPSALRIPKSDKVIQLRFRSDCYEMTLYEGRSAIRPPARLTQGQIKHVTIEMLPLERGTLRLSYEDRHVVIRADGKVWAMVPDICFMRLHAAASGGLGEVIEL